MPKPIDEEKLEEEFFQRIILNFDKNIWKSKENFKQSFLKVQNIKINYISPNYDTFIINVNEKQFNQIKDENGLYFFYNFKLESAMSDVAELANFSELRSDDINSLNITGKGQTIIVIDSFFDTNHDIYKR